MQPVGSDHRVLRMCGKPPAALRTHARMQPPSGGECTGGGGHVPKKEVSADPPSPQPRAAHMHPVDCGRIHACNTVTTHCSQGNQRVLWPGARLGALPAAGGSRPPGGSPTRLSRVLCTCHTLPAAALHHQAAAKARRLGSNTQGCGSPRHLPGCDALKLAPPSQPPSRQVPDCNSLCRETQARTVTSGIPQLL